MIDRLTIRYPDGAVELKCSVDEAVMQLADYEDTGRTPEEVKELVVLRRKNTDILCGMKYERFTEILKAESEDRLIVLPCRQRSNNLAN